MKILILEKEIYLAQSIRSRFNKLDYICDIMDDFTNIPKNIHADVILISSEIKDKLLYSLLDRFKDSTIILMISYISTETVAKPIQAGADDYILKPFMMEELIRKINHFKEYNNAKRKNENYTKLINSMVEHVSINEDLLNTHLPVIVTCKSRIYIDAFAMRYSILKDKNMIFIDFNTDRNYKQITNILDNEFIYAVNLDSLKEADRIFFLDSIADTNSSAIVASNNEIDMPNMRSINIDIDCKYVNSESIVGIKDYVKYVIKTNEDKYTDTYISEKLGISRKSLWEKRKKYNIVKKGK